MENLFRRLNQCAKYTGCSLKGQCHEIFCFWFFSWISFPPAPEYSIKTVSNFFENSRRYSQLKVCQKIFNQKNFNNFVWSPLGSRGNMYINFCLQVHFQVSAALYCSHYLPPVSMTPVANLSPVSLIPVAICHRRRWHRRQICRRCLKLKMTSKKNIYLYANSTTQRCPKEIRKVFLIKDFFHLPPVSTTPVVHLELRISPRIFEKIRNGMIGITRTLGKLIHEKNQKQKISWHCPFKRSNLNLSIQPACSQLQSYFKKQPVHIIKPNNVKCLLLSAYCTKNKNKNNNFTVAYRHHLLLVFCIYVCSSILNLSNFVCTAYYLHNFVFAAVSISWWIWFKWKMFWSQLANPLSYSP